jgi:ABC-2 type transport system permease protein
MQGLLAVYRKELADHLGSRRFLILFVLILFAGISSVYVAAQSIRTQVADTQNVFLLLFTTSSGALPSFVTFIGFLGPLVGLALAFDSVNGELNRGTLSRLLAQPIYRDAVINGKFLAGLTTITLMVFSIIVITSALGILVIAVIPTVGELLRLIVFLVLCTLYVGFWLALGTTFSVLLRQTTTAALAGIATWIFLTFFVTMIADGVAGMLANGLDIFDPNIMEQLVSVENTRLMVSRISPNTLFQEATVAMLMPKVRSLGPILTSQTIDMVLNPLKLRESIQLIWPHAVGLLALIAACFAVAYIRFMTQEIRSL